MKAFFKWAVVFAIVHFVLAALYAGQTPFEKPGILINQRGAPTIDVGAPDELQHIVYVRRIASGGGIPVLDPKDPDLDRTYQSHQPPLFYFIAAAWSKVFGDSAMGLRSVNFLIGGITVLGVFMLGWWTTKRGEVAVGASAIAALLPMNVALSSAVSNDPLLFCLCTWALALYAKGFSEGLTLKHSLIAGAVVGAAFITKTNSLALVPTIGLAVLLARKTLPFKSALPGLGLALAIGAVWWIRNTQVYGDPLAIRVFNEAFDPRVPVKPSMFIAAVGPKGYWIDMVAWWTARSFIGVFGYMDIFLGDTFYRLAVAAMGLLGLLGLMELRQSREGQNGNAHIMNVLFVVVLVAQFIVFNTTTFQGQARYLLPAIGPFAIALAMGVVGFSRTKPLVPAMTLAAAMLALNAYVLSMLPGEFAKRIVQTSGAQQTSKS